MDPVNKKTTSLTTLAGAPAAGDYFAVVDVSDTSGTPQGTSKKVPFSAMGGGGGGPATILPIFYAVNSNYAKGNATFSSLGDMFYTQLFIPFSTTITGLTLLLGDTDGLGLVNMLLYDSNGDLVANSALAGTNGTTAQFFMKVPFTTPYDAAAGLYYVLIQTDQDPGDPSLNTYQVDGTRGEPGYINGTIIGTFGVAPATITPGITFTTNWSPICSTY